ncbi:MAG: hypothetical protein ACJ789_15685 [Thermomicrobiales bacterium]
MPVAEGCTPGFWKKQGLPAYNDPSDPLVLAIQSALNGVSPTPDAPYASQLFANVFDLTSAQMTAAGLTPNLTISGAINLGGGGFNALARHGAAGLLSAGSGINYQYSVAQVYHLVHDPIASGDASLAATNASLLAAANTKNEQRCPTA